MLFLFTWLLSHNSQKEKDQLSILRFYEPLKMRGNALNTQEKQLRSRQLDLKSSL